MTTNRISSDPSGRSPSFSSKSSTSQTSFSTPHQSLNSTIREASTNNHPRNDGKDDMPPPSSSCPRTSTSAGTVRRSIHRQRHRHRRRPSPCPLHRHGLDHRQVVATVALALMTALSSPGICGSSTVLCAADAKTIRGRRELAREGQEPIGGEESRHEQQKQIEHEEAAKQLREEGMRQKTRRKRPQRHQQQPQPQQPEPLQIPARTLQEEEHHCPPNHSGWAPSSTCQSYFWCSAGVLSSLPYSCVDGLLYDHSQQTCVEASTVDCSVGHAILAGELDTSSPVAPVSPTAPPATTLPPTTSPPTLPPTPDPTSKPTDRPTTAPTEPQPTPSPTDRPTSLGPPLYYVDYPSQTCLSSAASGVEHPSWLDELSLYRTKRECCTDHFGWTGDITSCLGPNWVETNVIWAPTASPTLRPSVDPTVGPTSSPTGSPTPSPTERPSGVPSDRPSEGPTVSPTGAPSGVPTLGPTTTGPTGSPTTSAPTLAPFTSMPTFAGDGFDGHGGGANSMTQNSASAGGTASISEAFDSQGLSQTSNQQQPPSHSTSGAEAAAAAIRDQYMVQLLGWANTDIDVSAIEGGFSGWQYQYHQQSQFQFDLAPRTDPPTPGPTASPTHPPTSPPTIPTVMEEQSQQYQISELILPVQGDATISEKRPSLNFGSHQALAVNSGMNGPGDERFDSLLKFDIALLDLVSLSTSRSSSAVGGGGGANRKIEEARLEIYVMESCDSGGTFAVASPSASSLWDASTVTWENAPSASGGYPLATLGAVAAGQWYRVDMTSALTWYGRVLVEEETSMNGGLGLGEEYLTVRMETDAEKRCLFSSMESGEALAPRLIVKFAEAVEVEDAEEVGSMEEQSDALDGSHQDQQQAEEEAAASTPESPVEYPPLPPPPPPVPGDFLLLRATDDATVIATSSTFNFGTQDKLVVAFDSFTRGIYDSLIKFDLREVQSVLPRSAVLSLFAEADCTSAGMFTTTTSSGEVGVGEEWTEDEVTWANAPMGPVDGISGPGGADLGGSGSGGGMNIGTFGPILGNNWYGFNVGDAVTEAIKNGKETVTFRLSSGNMNPCQYTSREGGRAPKLMVSF